MILILIWVPRGGRIVTQVYTRILRYTGIPQYTSIQLYTVIQCILGFYCFLLGIQYAQRQPHKASGAYRQA